MQIHQKSKAKILKNKWKLKNNKLIKMNQTKKKDLLSPIKIY